LSHPMNHVRQSKVEKSRVSHLTKGYASGGAVRAKGGKVTHGAKADREMARMEMEAEGDKSRHRMDRPKRAKGGRVGKKKGNAATIVNVITGGHPAAGAIPPGPPMMPPGPPMGIAGPPPGAMPPPMAKPPMMPPPGPGGPPPMPMRAKGGRVQSPQTPTGTGVAPDSGVGSNKGDAVFNASRKNGTHISHSGNKDDGKDIGRGRVVTFSTGGGVRSFRAYGGRVESPDGVSAASKLPGGSGGGEARLAKEHRAERKR
jgi:hypothetical protein